MECTQGRSRDNQVLFKAYPWPLEPEDGATSDSLATIPPSTAVAVLVAVRERARVTSMFRVDGRVPIRLLASTLFAIAGGHTFINRVDASIVFVSTLGIKQACTLIGSEATKVCAYSCSDSEYHYPEIFLCVRFSGTLSKLRRRLFTTFTKRKK